MKFSDHYLKAAKSIGYILFWSFSPNKSHIRLTMRRAQVLFSPSKKKQFDPKPKWQVYWSVMLLYSSFANKCTKTFKPFYVLTHVCAYTLELISLYPFNTTIPSLFFSLHYVSIWIFKWTSSKHHLKSYWNLH